MSERLDFWHGGVAQLQFAGPPPNVSSERWRRLQFDAAALIDQLGPELIRLGWTYTDAVGLHPARPGVLVARRCLAIAINGGQVIEVTKNSAVIARPDGSRKTYRRQSTFIDERRTPSRKAA